MWRRGQNRGRVELPNAALKAGSSSTAAGPVARVGYRTECRWRACARSASCFHFSRLQQRVTACKRLVRRDENLAPFLSDLRPKLCPAARTWWSYLQGRGQRSAQSPQEGCPPATRAKSGVILESVARPRLWKAAGVGVADTEKGAVASVQISTGALTPGTRACATEAFVSVSWRSVEGIARGPESVGAPR